MSAKHKAPATDRKVLADIQIYPEPSELYKQLMESPGWPYKSDREAYLQRDRALVALLYNAELRISEALRLIKNQFVRKPDHILIRGIQLAKRKKGKIGYREARLPLTGERAPFTELILQHLDKLHDTQRLFPWSETVRVYDTGRTYTTRKGEVKPILSTQITGEHRAWQVVNALLPEITEHWLRAFGDNWLYDSMDHDLLAAADEVAVDPRTFQHYLRGRSHKYKAA